MNFRDKLRAAQQRNQTRLGIGLHIRVNQTPLPITFFDEPMLPFARAIIEATSDLVCAFVVSPWPFLYEGAAGVVALERIVQLVPNDIPLVFDGQFTMPDKLRLYLGAAFEQFNADAATAAFDADDSVAFAMQPYPNKSLLLPLGAHLSSPHVNIGHWVSSANYATWNSHSHCDEADLLVLNDEEGQTKPAFVHGDAHSVQVASDSILYASRRIDFAEAARAAAMHQREALGPPGA